jgi:hypothetical protein
VCVTNKHHIYIHVCGISSGCISETFCFRKIGVDGKSELKLLLKKWDGMVWIGFMWLRTQNKEPYGSKKGYHFLD